MNTKEKQFSRQQRGLIVQKMKEAFRASDLFKSLYPIQQQIGQDAILLRFLRLHFDYNLKTEVHDKGKETERKIDKYVFFTTIVIAGTDDLKIKVKVEIPKSNLDELC